MTLAALKAVARYVRRLGDRQASSDGQLLDRFCQHRDEEAYGELVRRHGPMVFAVCRRVLRHHQDAEDAFQAAFLVLARKAATIRREQSLGGWLFQVAQRIAVRARAGQERRRMSSLNDELLEPACCEGDRDLQPILDEELVGLPEHYRAAVVLCYVQGHSQAEAALHLATTVEAINSRLKRARELLRQRLARRGLTASGSALAAALAQGTAGAIPPALVEHTARAAAQFAAGAGACEASAGAVLLARGALSTMTSKLHLVVAGFLLLLGLLALGGAVRSGDTAAPGQRDPGQVKKQAEEPGAGKGDKPGKHLIILWMSGGPSQMDTFDLKPGQANGGPFKAIDTVAKGVQISETLPRLAKLTNHLAILRSVSHREGDHQRGSYLMRTGRDPGGAIRYPPLGAVLGKELGDAKSDLPNYVSIHPMRFLVADTYGSGFLDAKYGALMVGELDPLQADPPEDLALPPLKKFQAIAGERSEKMRDALAKAFALKAEKDAVRDSYGRTRFGQGCLLARRLVERGVPVVEVTMPGWDTHGDNFNAVQRLSGTLDAGFSSLLTDLRDRKLLDRTLVVWMGEFGRTPRINNNNGRDHWPQSFSVVLAGAGIKGGQAIGATNADGVGVQANPISPAELHATICRALGVDPAKENRTKDGVQVPLVEKGAEAAKEALR